MKKIYISLSLLCCLFLLNAQNQYTYESPRWFIGSGADTTYLVIDFQIAGVYDPPTSFIYGYLFNDSVSGVDILTDIDVADENLFIGIAGGFVDSIALGNYQGKNGVDGNFWGIWTDTLGVDRWVANAGTSTTVFPNEYFGLSFTDFAPAIVPDTAVAVNNFAGFTRSDLQYFVGTGKDTAVFVADFLNGNSYAWGYLFNDSVEAGVLLDSISINDDSLTISSGSGFLNDIIYEGNEGLAGMPNYWNTWSATNSGIWYTNIGLETTIFPNDWFGCSYPNFPPALYPSTPVAAEKIILSSIVNEKRNLALNFYPNPTNNIIVLENFDNIIIQSITFFNQLGEAISADNSKFIRNTISLNGLLSAGIYIISVQTENDRYIGKVIVKE